MVVLQSNENFYWKFRIIRRVYNYLLLAIISDKRKEVK